MKVSINVQTGLMIESQSDADDATLTANAVALGIPQVDVRIQTVTDTQLAALISARTQASKTLTQVQAEQLAIMETAYQAAITAPITYIATTFQADPESCILLDQALAIYTRQGAVPTGFWWKDVANNHVAMTLTQLQGLGDAIAARLWVNFQILDARKASIRSATTSQQVGAIVW